MSDDASGGDEDDAAADDDDADGIENDADDDDADIANANEEGGVICFSVIVIIVMTKKIGQKAPLPCHLESADLTNAPTLEFGPGLPGRRLRKHL